MARILDQVKGQSAAIHLLHESIAQKRLASSMLFVGPSGTGKKKVALGIAQALICETSAVGCGECGSCVRVEVGQSESVLLIEPVNTGIKIEQSRDVIQFLNLRKIGRARVVILDQAHLLNPQAANALLKSIEEPPSGSYFILISSQAGSLMPTIRSRVQTIRFQPLSREVIKEITQAEDWILDSCQGSVDWVRRLQENESELKPMHDQAMHAMYECLYYVHKINSQSLQVGTKEAVPSMPPALVKLMEHAKDRNQTLYVLQAWQKLLRDLGVSLAQSRWISDYLAQYFSEAGEWILTLDSRIPLEIADLCVSFEQDVIANVDRTLLFENFWYSCRRLKFSNVIHEVLR